MSTEIPSSGMPKQALLTQAEKITGIVIAAAGLLSADHPQIFTA